MPFDEGTTEIAQYVAARTKAGKLVSVAGGGDTVSALANAGVKDDFTYVSTAIVAEAGPESSASQPPERVRGSPPWTKPLPTTRWKSVPS